MHSSKMFLLYLLLISTYSPAMQLAIEQPTIRNAQDTSTEFLVLFRGVHFGIDMNPAFMAQVNYSTPEEIDSRYVSLSKDNKSILQRRAVAQEKLSKLRNSGPYIARTPSKGSENIPYASAYHWLMELYVNRYADFKTQLSQPSSELSELLTNYELSFDDIFLVSTSLNAKTSVKYALGLCCGNYRNWPAWQKDEMKSETLGYLDVFIIPRKDLEALGAFPVVEEFSQHNIHLPYGFNQNDYTVAEEYVIPLFIPRKYHRRRIPMIATKNRESKKDNFIEEFIRGRAKALAKKVNDEVEKLLKTEKGRRVFLYVLQNRLEDKAAELKPSTAVALHKAVAPLLIKTFEEINSTSKSSQNTFSLPSSIAIERVIKTFDSSDFSFQSNDFNECGMQHIAALVRNKNLTRVIMGTKRDFEEVGTEVLGMGSFRYEDIGEIDAIITAALQRTQPILFVVAFLIAPEDMRLFKAIESRSQQKISFEIDRQNYDAQQFECIEAEALEGESDIVRESLFPTCFSVEKIVTNFIAGIEDLVFDFSETLYALDGFAYNDLGCNLDLEELLLEDRDIPITKTKALEFLEKYEEMINEWDEDDLMNEVYEYLEDKYHESTDEYSESSDQDADEGAMDIGEDESPVERDMDRFMTCYDEALDKFKALVSELLNSSLSELEKIVEYASGNEEESSGDYYDSSSASNNKRELTRTVTSLDAEDCYRRGTILKKRALSKE